MLQKSYECKSFSKDRTTRLVNESKKCLDGDLRMMIHV